MHITLKIQMPAAPERDAQPVVSKSPPTLFERTEYAVHCMECESEKEDKALRFIFKVHERMQAALKHKKPNKEEQRVLQLIKPYIELHGSSNGYSTSMSYYQFKEQEDGQD